MDDPTLVCSCVPIYLTADAPEPMGHQWTGTCLVHGYTSDWFAKGGGKAYFTAYTQWGLDVQGATTVAQIPPYPRMEDYP